MVLGVPSPFVPGILLFRKPSKPKGKQPVFEKNDGCKEWLEFTLRMAELGLALLAGAMGMTQALGTNRKGIPSKETTRDGFRGHPISHSRPNQLLGFG